MSWYPKPHAVKLITRQLGDDAEQVISVAVDEKWLCLPKDASVLITADPGGFGYLINIEIMAGTLTTERDTE